MRRVKGRREERRYASLNNERYNVVVEAARLLYTREYKEYYQAKREAARRQGTTVLPTNSEIHQQLLLLADKVEGEDRNQRLGSMRFIALEMMELLEQFEPRLIGSTWTGHIRQGSDVDLHIHSEDLESVLRILDQAAIPYDVERVSSRKYGQEREFVHIHVHHPSGIPVEMTLYSRDWLATTPTCSISGGPMPRASLAQLKEKIAQEHPTPEPGRATDLAPSQWSEKLLGADLESLLPDLPELEACREVTQNHYHHLDVYNHTAEVLDHLKAYNDSSYRDFGELAAPLVSHLQAPGPFGWSRTAILYLAALCHDLGKPATWSLHRSGRIQFIGHEHQSESLCRQICERWGLEAAVTIRVCRLVAHHMEPVRYPNNPGPPSALYRMFRDLGELLPELLLLSLADVSAARGPAQSEHRIEEQRRFVLEMLEEYFSKGFLRFPNLPVSTTDLDIELGIGEGRLRDTLLDHLTHAYVDGEFQGREDGLMVASEMLETSLSGL